MDDFDKDTGLPTSKNDLECNLPSFLSNSIEQMKSAWEKKEKGVPSDWDCDYCELQSSINAAEVEHMISSEQAWYLREKYLFIKRNSFI